MASNAGKAPPEAGVSRWPLVTGWTIFEAVLMIFGGAMAIFEGIAAVAKSVFRAIRGPWNPTRDEGTGQRVGRW